MTITVDWTCPFCALLCDRYALQVEAGAPPQLAGSDCPRAQRALQHFPAGGPSAAARANGRAVDQAAAVAAAAALLAASRRPLFGGLATDVAGIRALYPLAARVHAVLDHAGTPALMPGLRALQDRGLYQVTLSELRSRADLVVCLGAVPGENFPEFWRLTGLATGTQPEQVERRVVFVGTGIDPSLAAQCASEVTTGTVPLDGDWLDTLTLLNALVAGKRVAAPTPLVQLAGDLQAARYAALVWEPGRLAAAHGTQAELLVESINALVKTLNLRTRAGGLALAGDDGAAAANQTVAWLSGLPLRTALAPGGLQHEPRAFSARQLLADGAVDAVLWVASFGPQTAPPLDAIGARPLVVLGHPAHAAALNQRSAPTVFIPVSTPGLGSAAHLFRADGVVMLPLPRVIDDGLPNVAQVAAQLLAAVPEAR